MVPTLGVRKLDKEFISPVRIKKKKFNLCLSEIQLSFAPVGLKLLKILLLKNPNKPKTYIIVKKRKNK